MFGFLAFFGGMFGFFMFWQSGNPVANCHHRPQLVKSMNNVSQAVFSRN